MNANYEESISSVDLLANDKKSKLFFKLHILFVALSIILGIYCFTAIIMLFSSYDGIFDIIFTVILVALFGCLVFVAMLFAKKRKFYSTSYDYVIGDKTFTIYHIYNVVKRKAKYSYSPDEIIKLGTFESNMYKDLVSKGARVIDLRINKPAKEDRGYKYIAVNDNDELCLIVVECKKELFNQLLLFASPTKMEK